MSKAASGIQPVTASHRVVRPMAANGWVDRLHGFGIDPALAHPAACECEAIRVTVVEISEAGEEAAAQEHIDDVARYLTRDLLATSPFCCLMLH
jgi:hypothetical protein